MGHPKPYHLAQLCLEEVTPTPMPPADCRSCPSAQVWKTSLSCSRVLAWPFPEAPELQHASQSIWNQPSQVTFRVYFLHLSALRETLFSTEIWHFFIPACFPGQQPHSPALPVIQHGYFQCCHCLCAFAILLSAPAPWVSGGRAPGDDSFDSSSVLAQRMLHHCCLYLPCVPKPSRTHILPASEISRMGMIQGTDRSKLCS